MQLIYPPKPESQEHPLRPTAQFTLVTNGKIYDRRAFQDLDFEPDDLLSGRYAKTCKKNNYIRLAGSQILLILCYHLSH